MQELAGRFLVFDGPDGSGKSTQFRRFAEHVAQAGLTVCEVREPGGTPIGERIRDILLDPEHEAMDLRCEMLLYMASRAQLVAQRIRPALERGELVLADRFISSTLAYQGAAGGLPLEAIRQVGTIAVGKYLPDLVVIFDLDEETADRRMTGAPRGRKRGKIGGPSLFADRVEGRGRDFQRAVREGYLAQAREDPAHYRVIDATADELVVFERLLTVIEDAMRR